MTLYAMSGAPIKTMPGDKNKIRRYVKSFFNSMYALNVKGAKYYGASFYAPNGWDGSFEWSLEDAQKYDYVLDLSTNKFVKEHNQ